MTGDEIERRLSDIGDRTASVRAPARLEQVMRDRIEGTAVGRPAWRSSIGALVTTVIVMSLAGTGLALAVTSGMRQPAVGGPGPTARIVAPASASSTPPSSTHTSPVPSAAPAPSPHGSPSPAPVSHPSNTPAPSSPPSPAGAAAWKPAPLTTWYEQLTGTVDVTLPYSVYEIDGFDSSAATVAALHARGRHVVCYIDAGAWESFRADASQFPAGVLGNAAGAQQRWLDIRQLAILQPIMQQRIGMCRTKGFDAVDLDAVDGYVNNSGFPLSAQDQLAYDTAVAGLAHAAGVSVALHGDVDQMAQLETAFDFAIAEQCFQYAECASTAPFLHAGKAIFDVEYASMPPCGTARQEGISAVQGSAALDGTRWASC